MSELNKSVEKAILILKEIEKNNQVGLRELARLTENSIPATERIIKTFEKYNILERNDLGKIILGRELYYLGKLVESRTSKIQLMLNEIQNLVEEINETVYLVERRDNYSVFIEGIQTDHLIQYVPEIGKLYDLPYAATGKAFMAYMNEKEINGILNYFNIEGKEGFNDLSAIRERGYALTKGERFEGLVGLAFPLLFNGGAPSLVLDIAIPMNRYSEEKLNFIIDRTKTTIEKLEAFLK